MRPDPPSWPLRPSRSAPRHPGSRRSAGWQRSAGAISRCAARSCRPRRRARPPAPTARATFLDDHRRQPLRDPLEGRGHVAPQPGSAAGHDFTVFGQQTAQAGSTAAHSGRSGTSPIAGACGEAPKSRWLLLALDGNRLEPRLLNRLPIASASAGVVLVAAHERRTIFAGSNQRSWPASQVPGPGSRRRNAMPMSADAGAIRRSPCSRNVAPAQPMLTMRSHLAPVELSAIETPASPTSRTRSVLVGGLPQNQCAGRCFS